MRNSGMPLVQLAPLGSEVTAHRVVNAEQGPRQAAGPRKPIAGCRSAKAPIWL